MYEKLDKEIETLTKLAYGGTTEERKAYYKKVNVLSDKIPNSTINLVSVLKELKYYKQSYEKSNAISLYENIGKNSSNPLGHRYYINGRAYDVTKELVGCYENQPNKPYKVPSRKGQETSISKVVLENTIGHFSSLERVKMETLPHLKATQVNTIGEYIALLQSYHTNDYEPIESLLGVRKEKPLPSPQEPATSKLMAKIEQVKESDIQSDNDIQEHIQTDIVSDNDIQVPYPKTDIQTDNDIHLDIHKPCECILCTARHNEVISRYDRMIELLEGLVSGQKSDIVSDNDIQVPYPKVDIEESKGVDLGKIKSLIDGNKNMVDDKPTTRFATGYNLDSRSYAFLYGLVDKLKQGVSAGKLEKAINDTESELYEETLYFINNAMKKKPRNNHISYDVIRKLPTRYEVEEGVLYFNDGTQKHEALSYKPKNEYE